MTGFLARPVWREAVAELIGTAFLLIAVVGSGIMAEKLSAGNLALALLANSLATGGALLALILALGAHMNPAVSLAAAATGGLRWRVVPTYLAAQITGAVIGVWLAHIMFDLPVWQISHHSRGGAGQWSAELIATFGLLVVIWGCRPHREPATALAVAGYIMGAYWFTASTSFANPAVTIARALSDSFAGIRPGDAPGFIAAQLLATGLAIPLLRSLKAPLQEAPAPRAARVIPSELIG